MITRLGVVVCLIALAVVAVACALIVVFRRRSDTIELPSTYDGDATGDGNSGGAIDRPTIDGNSGGVYRPPIDGNSGG